MEELGEHTMNYQHYSGQTPSSGTGDAIPPTWSRLAGRKPSKLHVFFAFSVAAFMAASLYYLFVYQPSLYAAREFAADPGVQEEWTTLSDADPSMSDYEGLAQGMDPNNKDALSMAAIDGSQDPTGKITPLAPKEPVVESNSIGRNDPFEPLVNAAPTPAPDPNAPTPIEEMPAPPPPPPKDLLEDIQFVGLVDDKNGNNTIAVLKVNDPFNGTQTVVKKVKDMFLLDGHKVYVKKVNRFSVDFLVDGKLRTKPLSPFVDTGLNRNGDDNGDADGGGGGNSAFVSNDEKRILKGLQGG